ncbi:MAG: hypothetical protein J6S67_16970 [Methanobrevibacter sp.]|nr:hypothetical protein [Methanobrevibacter sp.]
MKIEQIYEITNEVAKEVTGEEALVQEDLSNIVQVGTTIQNIDGWQNKFVQALVDRIGRTIFVNRPYSGSAPSVMMDAWEYGSILMKIASDLPEATTNESWELTDGASYDPFVYKANPAEAKFYDGLVTFELDKTIIDRQLKSSFADATQLNAFISMIFNEVDKAMTIRNDALVMRTINSMIGDTFYNFNSSGVYTSSSGTKCVNLLYLYNQKYGTSLTAAAALSTPDFLRFASYIMSLYVDRLAKMSVLFNIGGKHRFTPPDMLHTVLLSEFKEAAGVYLYDAANQFNSDYIKLPKAETVTFWQGSGTGYSFADTGKVYVTTGSNHAIEATGVLGVMFDRDALGVCNQNSRVQTQYNPKAEFTNYFYKRDARYFTDSNENFVVFFAA